jgi:hypothetical protein
MEILKRVEDEDAEANTTEVMGAIGLAAGCAVRGDAATLAVITWDVCWLLDFPCGLPCAPFL